MRSLNGLAALFALLGLFAPSAHARWLLADDCNATAAAWDYGVCSSLTSYEEAGLYPGAMPSTGGGATGGVVAATPAFASVAAGSGGAANAARPMPQGAATSATAAEDGTLGFATGGAQDIENFRRNLDAGYLPLPTDLTFEGLAKDYMFDTTSNTTKPCDRLFCPLYSVGLSPDPLLDTPESSEFYMAVGLDSGIQAADFARKRLNLVLVLDVSGSMGEAFDAYYYDGPGTQPATPQSSEDETKKKIDVAKEVLAGIVGLLNPEDSLAVVLFSDGACVPKPLGPVRCVDLAQLQKRIKADVAETSGTNFQAGIDAGGAQLTGCQACLEADPEQVENRIIFITDAQPNAGDTSDEGLLARVKALSADGVYTTIIGVGLDFNSQLVEAISKVRGANYFSVHSPGEFKRRLVDEFDFAVTPLVFDLALKVRVTADGHDDGWQILHVYGSPDPNLTALSSDGTVMKVNTLFPSPKTDEGIKGGVVLLRMRRPANAATPLVLDASYEDRQGNKFSSVRTVDVPSSVLGNGGADFYQSNGARKAVALARYTDVLHGWLLDQWAAVDPSDPIIIPASDCTGFPAWYCPVPVELYGRKAATGGCALQHWLIPNGCPLPPPYPLWPTLLGRWERQSQPLAVNGDAKAALKQFLPYFEAEAEAVGDPTMDQEVQVLKKLTGA